MVPSSPRLPPRGGSERRTARRPRCLPPRSSSFFPARRRPPTPVWREEGLKCPFRARRLCCFGLVASASKESSLRNVHLSLCRPVRGSCLLRPGDSPTIRLLDRHPGGPAASAQRDASRGRRQSRVPPRRPRAVPPRSTAVFRTVTVIALGLRSLRPACLRSTLNSAFKSRARLPAVIRIFRQSSVCSTRSSAAGRRWRSMARDVP